MHRRTIRTQLLLMFMLASLPLMGLALFDAHRDVREQFQDALDQQMDQAVMAADDIQDFLAANNAILGVLAQRSELRAMDPASCDHLRDILRSLSNRYISISVVRLDGLMTCSTTTPPHAIYAAPEGLALLNATQTGSLAVSRAHLGPVSRRWEVWQGEPVVDEQGRRAGMVIAAINLTDFHEIFAQYFWSGQTQFTLLDGNGQVLARSDAPGAWVGLDVSAFADLATQTGGESGWFDGTDLNGRRVLFSYVRLPNGWRVIAATDRRMLMEPIWADVVDELIFFLILMLVVVFVAYWFAGQISRPILEMAGVARAVTSGDVSRRVRPTGPCEVVEVAEAFNAMLDRRTQAEAALQRHHDHLEALVAERTAHLEHARDAAEAANRAKTVFLATMTHELRSPLNSILGFCGLLLQRQPGPLNDDQAAYLGYIQNGARRLLELISDLLDISRIEAGAIEVMWEYSSLPEIIAQVKQATHLKAQARGLELRVEIDPQVGSLMTDQGRLAQILINLLDNAVKFTESGEVLLRAEIEDRAPPHVRIRVQDTGIGIPADQLERIFEPFIQVDHGPARRYEGSGLGLSISKRLAELLGGTLEVQSQVGVGSIFILRLPVEPEVKI